MSVECDLSEITTLDSFAFPRTTEAVFPYMADIGGRYLCGESYYTNRESFAQSLLLYTCDGAGEIVYRGETIRLQPGMMILLDGKYAHRYRTAKGGPWEFFWFHYNDCSPHSFADYFYEKGMVVQKIPLEDVEQFFAELKEISKNNTGFGAMQNSGLLSGFFSKWAIFNAKLLSPDISEKEQIVDQARRYIQENFESEISLEKLAGICSVSKYYLIRIFGETVGMTPHQYLIYVRIGHAKLLLLSTADTVSEIGEKWDLNMRVPLLRHLKKLWALRRWHFGVSGCRPEKSVDIYRDCCIIDTKNAKTGKK